MAFSLKTWVNRISEYPNRRKLTHEDGSTELVTVARAEGQISAEGNAFSAEEMNDLEKRIADEFSSTNLSLNNCLKSVSDGKSTVASAITAQGVSTAADAEFATMVNNIAAAGNVRYQNGYSKGVTDADNRPNQSSANWQNGYAAGRNSKNLHAEVAGVIGVPTGAWNQTGSLDVTTFLNQRGLSADSCLWYAQPYNLNVFGATANQPRDIGVSVSRSGNVITITHAAGGNDGRNSYCSGSYNVIAIWCN